MGQKTTQIPHTTARLVELGMMFAGGAPRQHPEADRRHQCGGEIDAGGGFVESALDFKERWYRQREHSAQGQLAEDQQEANRKFRHAAIVAVPGEGCIRAAAKFAVCFLLVFGELAVGGMFALRDTTILQNRARILQIHRLRLSRLGADGHRRPRHAGLARNRNHVPGPESLWIVCAIWVVFCLLFAVYVVTLWTDLALLRARAFSLGLLAGLIAVAASVLLLKPKHSAG